MKVLQTKEFEKIFKQLNNTQKLAVNTIDGPVLVVAGPGTGKTQVLSARIANILRLTDSNPTSILALTFTESAAANMKRRLVSMIGQTGYYVKITTFHSFCVEVIQTHPDYFSIERGSEPLSELERYQIFQSILLGLSLDVLTPVNSPLYYLKDIIQAISLLKREGVSIDKYKSIIDNKKFTDLTSTRNQQKNKELLKIYSSYQNKLREIRRYDFEDMIQFVVDGFKHNKELLADYQEKLLYFLVDEYQDTNNSQNQLLRLLAKFWGENANLFVVGDPHQSIFRFQGASVENMLSFIKWYPKATVIRLDTGYRATQVFYDAASSVIRQNHLTDNIALSKFINTPINSALTGKGGIIVQEVPSQLIEYIYVAKSIKKLLKQNVNPEKIAVLYRHNSDAQILRETLDKWEIPYELDSGDDILKTESIRQLVNLFSLVLKVREGKEHSEDLFEVLSYSWFNLNLGAVVKVAQAAGHAKITINTILLKGFDYYMTLAAVSKITMLEFQTLVQLYENILKWGLRDMNAVFPQLFEEVINESGCLDWALSQENKVALLTNLSTLFREIKSLSVSTHSFKLKNFIAIVETITNFKIELRAEDLNISEGTVKLSTVHKAKGQEWDYVFLIHCIDGKWGNATVRDLIPLPNLILKNTDLSKKELNEDERRLFYVALTRAKKQISISYPLTIISQTKSKETNSSMFISEIPAKTIIKKTHFVTSEESSEFLKTLLTPPKTFFFKKIEDSFFKSLVNNLTMSATALNTYIRDTDEFVRNFLLRIPRSKSAPMAFGSAIHKTLEVFYKQLMKNNVTLLYKDLVRVFETELKQELLTDDDYKRRFKYGKKVIQGYYETHLASAQKPYLVERFFGGSFRPVIFDDIQLSGRIDRIDWVDESRGLVKVVDYKTGSPKTMGELTGSIKSVVLTEREIKLPDSIKSPYKRQLLFYKLLTDQDRTFDRQVIEGEFDFVEPDKTRGVYVKRTFSLDDSELDELKKLIKKVTTEIRNLEFLK